MIIGRPQRETCTSGAWPKREMVAHAWTPSANQVARHFQHNRRDIVASRRDSLAIQKCVPIVALSVLVESGHKCAESSIGRKYIWSDPNIRTNSRIRFATRTGFTLNQTLSGVTTKRIVARRLPHHKRLNVSMLTAISVAWFTKPELERNLFPRISVQVEPERVEPFLMKRIRRRQSHIRIHGHRHYRLARRAVK